MELRGTARIPGHARGPAYVAERLVTAPPGAVVVEASYVRSEGAVGYVLDAIAPGTEEPDRPTVGELPTDLFRDGDPLEIDGGRGTVAVGGVAAVPVVTAFLERADGRILLLRRSAKVGSFHGRWAGVSGYLEDPTPEGQAVREIAEETGFAGDDLALARTGRLVYARDGDRMFEVHPFRFSVRRTDYRLDWEHTEAAWLDPAEIGRRPTVPHLDRAWGAVAGPAPRKG